jgi:rubrerythrin
MQGRHVTRKKSNDPTYNAEWSGVTYAPQVSGKVCAVCGGHVHRESDSNYCPACDDYVRVVGR